MVEEPRMLIDGEWVDAQGGETFKVINPATASPLVRLDKFIATPHIGATTLESVIRMEDASQLRRVAEALRETEVYNIEFTMTTPGALGVMSQLVGTSLM